VRWASWCAGWPPAWRYSIRAAMGVLLATVFGLTVWIVGWALGAKAFDTFMIAVAIVVLAITARVIAPHLPNRQAGE